MEVWRTESVEVELSKDIPMDMARPTIDLLSQTK